MSQYLENLPRINFSVFTDPLDQLVQATLNKIEREWPADREAHSATGMILRMLVGVSNNTYRTMRYFCADIPSDPSRKLEYSVSAAPLARTILDALFTVVFLGENLTERPAWFLRAGWRELHEKAARMRAQYGVLPSWTEYLQEFEEMVAAERARWGISDDQAANPRQVSYWPTPAKMIPAATETETKEYLQYLNDWFYRELSQDSHLSWPGLWRRSGYFPIRPSNGRPTSYPQQGTLRCSFDGRHSTRRIAVRNRGAVEIRPSYAPSVHVGSCRPNYGRRPRDL